MADSRLNRVRYLHKNVNVRIPSTHVDQYIHRWSPERGQRGPRPGVQRVRECGRCSWRAGRVKSQERIEEQKLEVNITKERSIYVRLEASNAVDIIASVTGRSNRSSHTVAKRPAAFDRTNNLPAKTRRGICADRLGPYEHTGVGPRVTSYPNSATASTLATRIPHALLFQRLD